MRCILLVIIILTVVIIVVGKVGPEDYTALTCTYEYIRVPSSCTS